MLLKTRNFPLARKSPLQQKSTALTVDTSWRTGYCRGLLNPLFNLSGGEVVPVQLAGGRDWWGEMEGRVGMRTATTNRGETIGGGVEFGDC